ncbi:hypothetical protein EVAR_62909_1 [Eumeta japonica]|uniref:Uncharacterized protein n=1 Tax=Eumeta variegata TaxID=151549 RepID=A0A4C1Y8M5_EUMVA|nr:hypothetical protein EVAR_62909_1 [Eumeta japonica]
MRLKEKVVVEPSNADPLINIDLALIRAYEDVAVLASSYQKDYLNLCISPKLFKPLEERKEFWADVRDILEKCDKKKDINIRALAVLHDPTRQCLGGNTLSDNPHVRLRQ